jgi:hypothetical protein
MKINKAPGLGRFGTIIDDFNHESYEDWEQLKEINLKSLVTLVRGAGKNNFPSIAKNASIVGRARRSQEVLLEMKYGPDYYAKLSEWDEVDKQAFETRKNWAVNNTDLPDTWHSVSGRLDEKGKTLGTFAGASCLWHSNESGCYYFAPLVMLYGRAGMVGSATGFCSSTDWYEKQSESFRSELNELIAIHTYKPYSIAPDADEGHEAVMRRNFTMENGAEMPLVIKSPGGIKGLHFTWATVTGFVGMSKTESDALIDKLVKELYIPEYTWDAWWEQNQGDLLLFDNTIVTHNRTLKEGLDLKEVIAKRFGVRSACDYQGLSEYDPFYQEEYNLRRKKFMDPMNHNSHALYKHHTKMTMQAMTETERDEYVKRFTAEQLNDIISYDLSQDPHLQRFIQHKKPISQY